MLILRKLFARRDKMPSDSEKFIADPKIEEQYGKMRINVESSSTFTKQRSTLLGLMKERVNKLIKDIKGGHIYDDGDDSTADTHFLSDFRKRDQHVLSKRINQEDRLNYRVYKPNIPKKDGDKYTQKVVIDSCIGHKLNGSPDYVKDRQFKQLTSRRYEKK